MGEHFRATKFHLLNGTSRQLIGRIAGRAGSPGPQSPARPGKAPAQASTPHSGSPYFEALEPRFLLSADVFGGTLAGYLADPDKDLGDGILNDFASGIEDVQDFIDDILAETRYSQPLGIELPGLLDRSEPIFVAPNFADLVDFNAAAGDDLVLEDMAGNVDQPLDVFDADGDGNFDLTELVDRFVTDVFRDQAAAIGAGGAVDASDVESDLEAVSVQFGTDEFGNFTLTLDDVLFAFVDEGGGSAEYTFDFTMNIMRQETFSFDLGRNADLLKLFYGADDLAANLPDVTVTTNLSLDATVGLNATLSEAEIDPDPMVMGDEFFETTVTTTGGFFVRDTSFTASAEVDQTLDPMAVRLGFIDLTTTAASTFELDAAITATFAAAADGDTNGEISTAEITAALADIENLVDIEAEGSVAISLPIEITPILGFAAFSDAIEQFFTDNTLNPTIELSSSAIFADNTGVLGIEDPRTALTVSLVDFTDELLAFRNIDASGVIGLLSDLAGFLGSFEDISAVPNPDAALPGASELIGLFGLDIPFADGIAVTDLLQFGDRLDFFIDGMDTPDPDPARFGVEVPDFTSAQSLATLLDSLLGINLNAIGLTYDLSNFELLFNIDFQRIFGLADIADFNFDLDLSPIGEIQAAGSLDFAGSTDFMFTFGIELNEPQDTSIVTAFAPFGLASLVPSTGTNPVPSDGKLTDEVRFRLDFGIERVDVTLHETDPGGGLPFTGDNATVADLATDLQMAIDNAIQALNDGQGVLISTSQGDVPFNLGILVDVVNEGVVGDERLRITTYNSPFMEITELPDDTVVPALGNLAFDELGFAEGQEAIDSPLPDNGILSADATFELTLGAIMHTVTVAAVDTQDNGAGTTRVARIDALRQDLQNAIDDEFGIGAATVMVDSIPTGDPLTGDGVTLRIVPADGDFILVNNVNDIATNELGLKNHNVSSEIEVISNRDVLEVLPNSVADEIAADGQLASDAMFTLELTRGSQTETVVISIARSATLENDSPSDLANDINLALQNVVFDDIADLNGVPISRALIAEAVEISPGNFGIRFSAPFLLFDTLRVSGADSGFGYSGGNINSPAILGPKFDGAVTGADFTIELTEDDGEILSAAFVNFTNAASDLEDLVSDLNDELVGTDLEDKVVVGLVEGRIVFAALPNTTAGEIPDSLRIVSTDGNAKTDLGLEDNLASRSRGDVEAFIQDAVLGAEFDLAGSATGSANFGFIGLDFGTLDGNVSGDVGINLTANATDNRLQLQDLLVALGDVAELDALIDFQTAVTVGGMADFTVGNISISGGGGIVTDLASELGEVFVNTGINPDIVISVADITDLDLAGVLQGISVTPNLGSITDFANFDFDDIMLLLETIADFFGDLAEIDFLSEPLPLLDIRLTDALGFIDDFLAAVEDIRDNPAAQIQDLLSTLLEGLQIFPGATTDISFESNSPGILTFDIDFSRSFAKFLPINIDLVDLAADAGITLPSDLVNLAGAANLDADFGIDFNFEFGIDVADFAQSVLSNPTDPLSAIRDNIFFNTANPLLALTAFAEASNVTFTAAIGPLGVFISNGGAILNEDGVLGNTNPATFTIDLPDGPNNDGQLSLDEILNFSQLFSEIQLEGLADLAFGVGAVLPVSFPTASNFIGNIDFSGSLTDPFNVGAAGIQFSVNSFPDFNAPDILDLINNLGLIDGINLFAEGIDLALGTLGDIVDGEIFGIDDISKLPFIGDALSDAGAFFDDIRNEVVQPLLQFLEQAPEVLAQQVEDIRALIENAIDGIGFLSSGGIDILIDGELIDNLPELESLLASGQEMLFDLQIGKRISISAPDVDFGLPILGFEIEDPITITLDLALDIGFGLSITDGFFLQFDPTGDDLSISLEVILPTMLTGRLGFLQVTGTKNVDMGNPEDFPDLLGTFAVNVTGDDVDGRIGFTNIANIGFVVEFGARADVDYTLSLGLNGGIVNDEFDGNLFPSVQADFGLLWGFGDLVSAQFPEIPEISFNNLGLNVGSFLSDTIGPVISEIQQILDPIQPIIDVLVDPIPVISDLAGQDISLLDIAGQLGFLDPRLIEALQLILGLIDDINAIDLGGGDLVLSFGDFSLGGAGGVDLSDPFAASALNDPSMDFTAALSSLGDTGATGLVNLLGGFDLTGALGGIGNAVAEGLLGGTSDVAESGFSFPFLEDPSEVFGLLFGRDMTLVQYDLAPLVFGFEYDVFFPIWGPLGVQFGGGIEAIIDFAFGYDTAGIRKFASGGFDNPLDLLGGFFIFDDSPAAPGIDVPEIVIKGKITGAAAINVGVASAGVGGGIFATINFDLNDPNNDLRIRIDELLGNLFLGLEELGPLFPLAVFDVTGIVEAQMFAFLEILFVVDLEWQFGPSLPLLEFDISFQRDPVLATDMGDGTLRLNTGEFSSERLYGDLTDDNEEFFVASDGNDILVWSTSEGVPMGDAQRYSRDGGFTRILGLGGQGDDIIDLSGVTLPIFAELNGQAGSDELTGGAGNDLLIGESGNDIIRGGMGMDRIFGGSGNDKLLGEDGADVLFGGAGADIMIGGMGADRLRGGDDNDVLSGEDGNDILIGDAGDDWISGGADDDVIDGGSGRDRIFGDFEFVLLGDCTVDTNADDLPVLIDPVSHGAVHGADLIGGGGGSDFIQGDGGNDRIWGDSGFEFDNDEERDAERVSAGDKTVFETATNDLFMQQFGAPGTHPLLLDPIPVLILPIFGDDGNDNISGGGGSDVVFGEKGNDLIRGDRIDNNNPFSQGAANLDPDPDGNDLLVGGRGADIIYGNAGNDEIEGGLDNDFLFGNADDDVITGDVGNDVIFGDNGLVQLFVMGQVIDVIGVAYNGFTTDINRLITLGPDAGEADGNDNLNGGRDGDFIFGGGGTAISPMIEDTIVADSGDDIAFGDNGEIVFNYFNGSGNLDPILAALSRAYPVLIQSIMKDTGADDDISGGSGRDILIGGKGNDLVSGDIGDEPAEVDSRDIIFGDHGQIDLQIFAELRSSVAFQIQSNEDALGQGGKDVIDAKQQDDIVIAGPDDDMVTGGTGDDVIIGDRGNIELELSSLADKSGTFSSIDFIELVTFVESLNVTMLDQDSTGIDTLSGGQDNDIVIGGGKGDFIFGDTEVDGVTILMPAVLGQDTLLGDNGFINFVPGVVSNPGSGLVTSAKQFSRIETTDTSEDTGGADIIEGDQGDDIILGGVNGAPAGIDQLSGENEDDIILGDNGFLEFDAEGDESNLDLDLISTKDFMLGGRDLISGGGGADFALGGTGADDIFGDVELGGGLGASPFGDILIGDQGEVEFAGLFVARIETTDTAETDGGNDFITGDVGDDVAMGGVGSDEIFGGINDDILLGDEGIVLLNLVGDGNPLTPDLIATKNSPVLGQADRIFGEAGRDIAMGGTGGDIIIGDNTESVAMSNIFDVTPEDGDETSGADILIGDQGQVELFDANAPGASAFLNTNITLIQTTDNDELLDGGIDIIQGSAFGDVIIGGVRGDILLGEAEKPEFIGVGLGGDDIILGDEGELRYNLTGDLGPFDGEGDGDAGTLDLIQTFATGVLGGVDIIHGDDGNDIAMGGTAGDFIYGDLYRGGGMGLMTSPAPGSDTLMGDGGLIRFNMGVPNVTIIRSIETDQGGSDVIEGNEKGDIILGGQAGDLLYGEAADLSLITPADGGDDTILGDNGELSWILATDIIVGRPDVSEITLDADKSNLDRITTIAPNDGGNDVIRGNAGSDIILGGTGFDIIWGDTEDSDPNLNVDDPDGNPDNNDDLVFGDHGKLYPTVGMEAVEGNPFFNNFFFSIDTNFSDDGDGDIIFGNPGRDILLGGQGDDVMFGGAGDDDMIGGHNISGELGAGDGENAHDDLDGLDPSALAALVAELAAFADPDGVNSLTTTLVNLDPSDINEINDLMDGGEDDDVMAGDNAYIIRQGLNFFTGSGSANLLSPRFQQVNVDGALYAYVTTDFDGLLAAAGAPELTVGFVPNVTGEPQDHLLMTLVRSTTLLDHNVVNAQLAVDNPAAPRRFGNDIMVGGLNDDEMFGELGDDIIQGDGALTLVDPIANPAIMDDGTVVITPVDDQSFNAREINLLGVQTTVRFNVFEADADGDDYIEGNSGNDRIYGNLGQDDIIGGSSELFGLGGVAALRPDGADLIYGGAANAALIARNAGFGDGMVDITGLTDVLNGERHARDADTILGDNGNIFRIVDAIGDAERFNYDAFGAAADGYTAALPISVRAVGLVDYQYVYIGAVPDELLTFSATGAGDLIYGESGDDTVHGQVGDDVIFGNSEDDDIYGEHGADFLFGGTGVDGILGDDGIIFTRRNSDSYGEPLFGINMLLEEQTNLKNNEQADPNSLNALIFTPGNIQRAIINVEGELNKSVHLVSFRLDDLEAAGARFNDIIFGGLADTFTQPGGSVLPSGDFLHGGDGSDGISGAEALPFYYDATGAANFGEVNDVLELQQAFGVGADPAVQPAPFWRPFAPVNPGNILNFGGDGDPNEFAYYDEFSPRRKIMLDANGDPVVNAADAVYDFFLNFSPLEGLTDERFEMANEGAGTKVSDGDDIIFGDLGNDWMVGGTGRDHMFAGRGSDLLNMDDDHDSPARNFKPKPKQTEGDLENDTPDAFQAYSDIAYGGAGRDVLILNTGADRAIDWVGEFNSFIVPFSPFGAFHISRSLSPHVEEFLLNLSESDGADQSLPDGKLYVDQKRADVRTDDPDPARNFEPFGETGMVRQEDRDWGEQTGAPDDPQAGNLQGKREVMRRELFTDESTMAFAASVGDWTLAAGAYSGDPITTGDELVSIFHLDQMLPNYTEILVTASADKAQAGFKSNAFMIFDYLSATDFKFAGINQALDKIQIGHRTVDGWIVDVQSNMQLKHKTEYDLTLALHGTIATIYVNGGNALSFVFEDALQDGLLGLGADNASPTFDDYQVQKLPPVVTFEFAETFDGGTNVYAAQTGAWSETGGMFTGAAVVGEFAVATQAVPVQPFSRIWLEASLATDATGGVVFDYVDATHFKFAALDVLNDEVVIGHISGGSLVIDASFAASLSSGTSYDLKVGLLGGSVSVELDGVAVAGHVFHSVLNDGAFGLYSADGTSDFDSATISGDDPAYLSGEALMASANFGAQFGAGAMINQTTLDSAVRAAFGEYSHLFENRDDLIVLEDLDIRLADLPGDMLGLATDSGQILIDGNAAGYGWYYRGAPSLGQMDLVTTIIHEIGHLNGNDHAAGGLMAETLAPGHYSIASDGDFLHSNGLAGISNSVFGSGDFHNGGSIGPDGYDAQPASNGSASATYGAEDLTTPHRTENRSEGVDARLEDFDGLGVLPAASAAADGDSQVNWEQGYFDNDSKSGKSKKSAENSAKSSFVDFLYVLPKTGSIL